MRSFFALLLLSSFVAICFAGEDAIEVTKPRDTPPAAATIVWDHCDVHEDSQVSMNMDTNSVGSISHTSQTPVLTVQRCNTAVNSEILNFNREVAFGEDGGINDVAPIGSIRYTTTDAEQQTDLQVKLPAVSWTSITSFRPKITSAFYTLTNSFTSLGTIYRTCGAREAGPQEYCADIGVAFNNNTNERILSFRQRSAGVCSPIKTFSTVVSFCNEITDPTCVNGRNTIIPSIRSADVEIDSKGIPFFVGVAPNFPVTRNIEVVECNDNKCNALKAKVTLADKADNENMKIVTHTGSYTIIYVENPSLQIKKTYVNPALTAPADKVTTTVWDDNNNGAGPSEGAVEVISKCCNNYRTALIDTAQKGLTSSVYWITAVVKRAATSIGFVPNGDTAHYQILVRVCKRAANSLTPHNCGALASAAAPYKYVPNQPTDRTSLGVTRGGVDTQTPVLFDSEVVTDAAGNERLFMVVAVAADNRRIDDTSPTRAFWEYIAFLCTNEDCTTYIERQIIDSDLLFNAMSGEGAAVPSPNVLDVEIHPDTGLPVILVGSASSLPIVINCMDISCQTADFQITDDTLAGHFGDASLHLNNNRLEVISTAAYDVVNEQPVSQQFQNAFASPDGTRCNSNNAGSFVTSDGKVYVCTKLPKRPFDFLRQTGSPTAPASTTILYHWAQLGGRLRTYEGAAGLNCQPPNCPF